MKDKLCPRCHGIMIIDEWCGWVWICPNCGVELDPATPEEIAEWEKENATENKKAPAE